MPQEAAEAVEIQPILQLLVCEGMTASVRRDADIGIDAYRVGGLPHEYADCLFRQQLAVFAQEDIFLHAIPAHEVFFPRVQILVHKLSHCWILWDNSFLAAFAVNHKVCVLYLIQLHVDKLAQSDPRIKENHKDHAVAYTDIVASVEVFYHPQDLFAVEGVDQHLRLFYISHTLGQDLFAVTLPLGIGAKALDRFQQIVDVCGLAASVLQGADILLHMDRLEFFKLNDVEVFPNKMAEFVELFFIILNGQVRQFPDFAIKEKLVNQFV